MKTGGLILLLLFSADSAAADTTACGYALGDPVAIHESVNGLTLTRYPKLTRNGGTCRIKRIGSAEFQGAWLVEVDCGYLGMSGSANSGIRRFTEWLNLKSEVRGDSPREKAEAEKRRQELDEKHWREKLLEAQKPRPKPVLVHLWSAGYADCEELEQAISGEDAPPARKLTPEEAAQQAELKRQREEARRLRLEERRKVLEEQQLRLAEQHRQEAADRIVRVRNWHAGYIEAIAPFKIALGQFLAAQAQEELSAGQCRAVTREIAAFKSTESFLETPTERIAESLESVLRAFAAVAQFCHEGKARETREQVGAGSQALADFAAVLGEYSLSL